MNLENYNTHAVQFVQGQTVIATVPPGFNGSSSLLGNFDLAYGFARNVVTNTFSTTNGTCWVSFLCDSPTGEVGVGTNNSAMLASGMGSGAFAGPLVPVAGLYYRDIPNGFENWSGFNLLPNAASCSVRVFGITPTAHPVLTVGPTNGQVTYTTNINDGTSLGSVELTATTRAVVIKESSVQTFNHEIELACLLGGVIVGMSVNVFRFVLSLLGSMATGGE